METPFVEQHCVIEHEGHSWESGGSFLVEDEKGRLCGILYAHGSGREATLGTWRGDELWPARVTNRWTGNFGEPRATWYVRIDGRLLWGRQAGDNDLVRVREVRDEHQDGRWLCRPL